jgi:hypothetical protein
MDPRKRSVTVEPIASDETILDGRWVGTDRVGSDGGGTGGLDEKRCESRKGMPTGLSTYRVRPSTRAGDGRHP